MRTRDFGVFNKSLQSELNLRNMEIKAYSFGKKNKVGVLQRQQLLTLVALPEELT